MNWKHTRAERDQVLESSRLLRSDQEETAEALLASIFSDPFKNRKNFITHNIDGAYGAAQVLFNFLNPINNAHVKRVERIAQAVKEHQIAPPEFMARAAAITISKKLMLPRFDPMHFNEFTFSYEKEPNFYVKRDIAALYVKISDPYNKQYLVEDLAPYRFHGW